MNGKGVYEEANALTRYEGQFKDGLMHGLGVYTKKDESVIKGIWKNDKIEKIIVYQNTQAMNQHKKELDLLGEGPSV